MSCKGGLPINSRERDFQLTSGARCTQRLKRTSPLSSSSFVFCAFGFFNFFLSVCLCGTQKKLQKNQKKQVTSCTHELCVCCALLFFLFFFLRRSFCVRLISCHASLSLSLFLKHTPHPLHSASRHTDTCAEISERANMSQGPSRVIYIRNVNESSKKQLFDFLSQFGTVTNCLSRDTSSGSHPSPHFTHRTFVFFLFLVGGHSQRRGCRDWTRCLWSLTRWTARRT